MKANKLLEGRSSRQKAILLATVVSRLRCSLSDASSGGISRGYRKTDNYQSRWISGFGSKKLGLDLPKPIRLQAKCHSVVLGPKSTFA